MEQTSILAELNAVWFVIHYTSWPITIHCDCQYVVDVVGYLCENHIYETPFPDNFRILESIRENIRSAPGRVTIVKVKGHAKFTPEVLAKCESGEINFVDILANHAVDLLAVEGSKMHDWDTSDANRYVRDVKSGVNHLVKMLRIMRSRYAKLEELGLYTRDDQKPIRNLSKEVEVREPGLFHGPSLDKHRILVPDGFDPRQRCLRWNNEPSLIFTLVSYFNQITVIPGLEIPVAAFILDVWFEFGVSFTALGKHLKWSIQDGVTRACYDLRCFHRIFGAPFRFEIKQRTVEGFTQYNLPRKGSAFLCGWRLIHNDRVHDILKTFTTLGDPFPSWFVPARKSNGSENPPVLCPVLPDKAPVVVPSAVPITETPSNIIRLAHGLVTDKRTQTADINRVKMIIEHNSIATDDQHIFETTWDEQRAFKPFDKDSPVVWFQHSARIFCRKCRKGFSLNKLRSVLQTNCETETTDGDSGIPQNVIVARPSESPCNVLRLKYGLHFDKRTETADHGRILLIQEHNKGAIRSGLHVFPTSWDDALAFKAFTAADPNNWFQNSIRIQCSRCDFKSSLKCLRKAFALPCDATHARSSSSSGS